MSQVSAHCCAPAARLAFHVIAGELHGEGARFGGVEEGSIVSGVFSAAEHVLNGGSACFTVLSSVNDAPAGGLLSTGGTASPALPSPVQRAQRVVRDHHSSVWVGAGGGGAASKERGRGGSSWRQWVVWVQVRQLRTAGRAACFASSVHACAMGKPVPSMLVHLGGGGLAFGGG